MKHLKVIDQFREDLANLSRQVETSVAMGNFDINKVCEDVFCGLFKELYGFNNLRNLNEEEKNNFPGIDLADDEARIAIQVSSDKKIDKIKDSLTKIINHGLHEKYDRFIFYFLTRKQGSYAAESIEKICQKKIKFDTSTDIMDFTDLASKGANASVMSLKKASDVLGAYMRGCDIGLASQDFDPPKDPPEKLSGNLVEFYFPQSLYIAEILPEVFDGKKVRSQRKAVKQFVKSQDRSVPSDFEVNAGKLITFHNLGKNDNPFAFLIDEGTIEPFQPSDFYNIDEDYERVFKSLLRFSLQQKLYRHHVLWKHIEGLFIFLPKDGSANTRMETWVGQKKATCNGPQWNCYRLTITGYFGTTFSANRRLA